jgi:hypothetical protein
LAEFVDSFSHEIELEDAFDQELWETFVTVTTTS